MGYFRVTVPIFDDKNVTFHIALCVSIGLTVPQTANMICALSIGDIINGSTTNRHIVLTSLNDVFKFAPNITQLCVLSLQPKHNHNIID